MRETFYKSIYKKKYPIWIECRKKRIPYHFVLELTTLCNNNCRHCYINIPAKNHIEKQDELQFNQITEIIDYASFLGGIRCALTGGEALMREDFSDIFLYLKKRGFLITIYTNATLITDKHIKLFKQYPPQIIETTVYGVTKETYERVTRNPGSYALFRRGLEMLLKNGISVRLKAMILHSNLHEYSEISKFCKANTCDSYRFDPFLHLRYDQNTERNREIISERPSSDEIVSLEMSDPTKIISLEKAFNISKETERGGNVNDMRLFQCGTGISSYTVSSNGIFRPCSSLWHPDCVYDLKKGNLIDAWNNFVPKIREMRWIGHDINKSCLLCPKKIFCYWCPAYSYLETGNLYEQVDYFCKIASARAKAFKKFYDRLSPKN